MLQRLERAGPFCVAVLLVATFVYVYQTTGMAVLGQSRIDAPPPRIAVTIFPTQAPAVPKAVAVAVAASTKPQPAQELPIPTQPPPPPTPQPQTPTQPASQTQVAQAHTLALPESAHLQGMRHQQQSWNNCGPATLSMLLSYFGDASTQRDIAQVIKPYNDDKNVSPEELVAFAQSAGYKARIVIGGDIALIKTFVASNLPVIVETWFIPDPNDEMGHYQLLVGYDGDTLRFFDSYHGPNVTHSVDEFDPLWKVFNRLFVVAWRDGEDALVQNILGPRWDETTMTRRALAVAEADLRANPKDKFAWFNAGTNWQRLGDGARAVEAYTKARALKLPWRMLWYQFGIYEAHFAQGNYATVVKLANETLRVTKGLEESYFWRGKAQAALGNIRAARQDFVQALQYRQNFADAQAALEALP
jgi:tetratricopeptide (TPR) repeat protein